MARVIRGKASEPYLEQKRKDVKMKDNNKTNYTNVTLNSTSSSIKAEPYPFSASVKCPKYLSTNTNLKPSLEFVSDKNKLDCFAFARNDVINKTVKNLFPYFPISFFLKKLRRFRIKSGMTFIKQSAFTLAEILITLGIIGVVAAMTIPTLMTNIKAQKMRTAFLKQYSVIQQVFKQMESDDISLDPSTYAASTFYKTFANYLTGATLCTSSSDNELCYHRDSNVYKGILRNYLDDGNIVMKDGTLLMFENTRKTVHTNVFITVDLNGIKNPPNALGFDTFTFEFKDGVLRTMGDKDTQYQGDAYCNLDKVLNETNTYFAYHGIACAQKAKEDSDYFKKLYHKYK